MTRDKQEYVTAYAPSLLQSVLRQEQRQKLGIMEASLPFGGLDIWNAWEFSWLSAKGKPEVALLRLRVPAESSCLTESRSLKFYLGSFSNTRFQHPDQLVSTLASDLASVVGTAVEVELLNQEEVLREGSSDLPGTSLDLLDVAVNEYRCNPELLQLEADTSVSESLHTHLFKSLCPMTGQPDFASILIQYEGNLVNHEALLRYLVSYREHAEFAEQVTERIFVDLMNQCQPESLAVSAYYTRRGGIDINACRAHRQEVPPDVRLWRQ